jgi:hypothetical protein
VRGGADTRRAGEHLHWLNNEALRCLSRAAALMTDPDEANKGEALFWTGMATIRIAQGDPELAAHDRCLQIVAALSRRTPPRVPGPYSGT